MITPIGSVRRSSLIGDRCDTQISLSAKPITKFGGWAKRYRDINLVIKQG
ncbi:MAG: hypothetical protein LBB23_04710 [Rickettsiales bacterium]|nr:hypothetical protein [Rickettsiales bacterium]